MRAALVSLLSLFPIFLSVVAMGHAFAEEALEAQPPRETDAKRPFELHGFLLGAVTGRVTGKRPPRGDGGDFVLGEERLRLDLKAATRSGDAFLRAKGDVFHDAIANEIHGDLREAYAGYAKGPADLRFGRQIVTWGVGDLFYINDVFPKDWESYFSGRPMEYFKLGADGLRTQVFSNVLNADLLVIPFFTPDTLPSTQRFFLYDPFSAIPNRTEMKPRTRYSNVEVAMNLYRRIAGADLSVYFSKGFWKLPSERLDDPAAPTTVTTFYPVLYVYGLSLQRGLFGGIISAEAGYYDSRDDNLGSDSQIPNSQWRFLAGYQREFWRDFTAWIQFYGEVMERHAAYKQSLPAGSPVQDRLRGVVSVRLTQWLHYNSWKLALFAAVSPTDVDYFLQPEISYRVTDDLGIAIGGNIFGGRKGTTFFGQLANNDNVFFNVRYDF